MVSVVAVSALSTFKARLSYPITRVSVVEVGTLLACVMWGNLEQRFVGHGHFVGQKLFELPQTNTEQRSVQS